MVFNRKSGQRAGLMVRPNRASVGVENDRKKGNDSCRSFVPHSCPASYQNLDPNIETPRRALFPLILLSCLVGTCSFIADLRLSLVYGCGSTASLVVSADVEIALGTHGRVT